VNAISENVCTALTRMISNALITTAYDNLIFANVWNKRSLTTRSTAPFAQHSSTDRCSHLVYFATIVEYIIDWPMTPNPTALCSSKTAGHLKCTRQFRAGLRFWICARSDRNSLSSASKTDELHTYQSTACGWLVADSVSHFPGHSLCAAIITFGE
jgi:hypothetical protein